LWKISIALLLDVKQRMGSVHFGCCLFFHEGISY
jgi:hypothetical protein